MDPKIPIDHDHSKYGCEDHNEKEEEFIRQIEGDDIVPEMQSQEQLSTSGGDGGTHSSQASCTSGSISTSTKCAKATTSLICEYFDIE